MESQCRSRCALRNTGYKVKSGQSNSTGSRDTPITPSSCFYVVISTAIMLSGFNWFDEAVINDLLVFSPSATSTNTATSHYSIFLQLLIIQAGQCSLQQTPSRLQLSDSVYCLFPSLQHCISLVSDQFHPPIDDFCYDHTSDIWCSCVMS